MQKLLGILLLLGSSAEIYAQIGQDSPYSKATEGNDTVLNRIYPVEKKIEVSFDAGTFFNDSYLLSILLHNSITYFRSNRWGFGFDAIYSINEDKYERRCIETFYNDPDQQAGADCAARRNGPDVVVDMESESINADRISMGPAYVPIRELSYLLSAVAIWNPVYGKQLYFMSQRGHLDIFVTMGAGIALSQYYKEKTQTSDGRVLRGKHPDLGEEGTEPGVDPDEEDTSGKKFWGNAGRPAAEDAVSPMLVLGIGQKFHFSKKFNFKIELRNHTLMGTPLGFEPYFAVWGGLSYRF